MAGYKHSINDLKAEEECYIIESMQDSGFNKRYCIITELEMDALLKHDKGWVKSVKGNEYVYGYKTKKNPNITVYVYSSISPNGISRGCGSDAIRVCAVNTVTNKGIIKSKRINRVPGWDVRLQAKVMDVIKQIL